MPGVIVLVPFLAGSAGAAGCCDEGCDGSAAAASCVDAIVLVGKSETEEAGEEKLRGKTTRV